MNIFYLVIQQCQNIKLQLLHNNNGLSIWGNILLVYHCIGVCVYCCFIITHLYIPGHIPGTWTRLSRNVELLGAKFDVCQAFLTSCGAPVRLSNYNVISFILLVYLI